MIDFPAITTLFSTDSAITDKDLQKCHAAATVFPCDDLNGRNHIFPRNVIIDLLLVAIVDSSKNVFGKLTQSSILPLV